MTRNRVQVASLQRPYLPLYKGETDRLPRLKTNGIGGSGVSLCARMQPRIPTSWVYFVALAIPLGGMVYLWLRHRSLHVRVRQPGERARAAHHRARSGATDPESSGGRGHRHLAGEPQRLPGVPPRGVAARATRGFVDQRPDDRHRPIQWVQRPVRTPDRRRVPREDQSQDQRERAPARRLGGPLRRRGVRDRDVAHRPAGRLPGGPSDLRRCRGSRARPP